MKKRSDNEAEDFRDFLNEVSLGNCTIELWNEFAIGAYKNPEVELLRKQLFQKALNIGQCSAVPFPPILAAYASQLRNEQSG